ncbi:MAG: glycosyltransferase [Gammaproteobacteria bacterium]
MQTFARRALAGAMVRRRRGEAREIDREALRRGRLALVKLDGIGDFVLATTMLQLCRDGASSAGVDCGKPVRSPPPARGISDGINKGFRRATGDWLMWLNADDCLLPGALERVTRFVAKHPEADMCWCSVR